jgi:transposase
MGTKNIPLIKKKCQQAGGIIVFEDEAAFRQDPTIFRSWFRRGLRSFVPTYGQRNTQHVYGAVSIPKADFSYRFTDSCNSSTHQHFLEVLVRRFYPKKIFLVEDNAKYHKSPDMWSWFTAHRKEIEPWFLPPYSPKFNPMESLWGYTRREGTHNHFFQTVDALIGSIKTVFRKIQYHPCLIENYLVPFY